MAKAARASTAEWNILVFLNAKNNLESFSFLNFEQMAKVGSTDQGQRPRRVRSAATSLHKRIRRMVQDAAIPR